jgi:anti-anti-sigma factor
MLNVTTKNLGPVAVLNLEGQVMIGKTAGLREAVRSLPRTSSVTLDLSRVTLVDAHGLGVMLRLREESHAKGVSFQLINVSSQLRQVLQMTRLDAVFQINSTAEHLAFRLAA